MDAPLLSTRTVAAGWSCNQIPESEKSSALEITLVSIEVTKSLLAIFKANVKFRVQECANTVLLRPLLRVVVCKAHQPDSEARTIEVGVHRVSPAVSQSGDRIRRGLLFRCFQAEYDASSRRCGGPTVDMQREDSRDEPETSGRR